MRPVSLLDAASVRMFIVIFWALSAIFLLLTISLISKGSFGKVSERDQIDAAFTAFRLFIVWGLHRGARAVLDLLHASAYGTPYPPLKVVLWNKVRRTMWPVK